MRVIKFLILFLVFISLLASNNLKVAYAFSSDWPSTSHDLCNSGFNIDEGSIEPPLELKWIIKNRKSIDETRSRPVVAGDVVYIARTWPIYEGFNYKGMSGLVDAISLENASIKWTIPNVVVNGSPVVSNGRIYFSTIDGFLYAANILDGHIEWSRFVGSMPTTPSIYGHMIYIASSAKLLCIKADAGEIQWEAQLKNTIYPNISLAISNDLVIAGGSNLTVFSANDGHIVWSVDNIGACSSAAIFQNCLFVSTKYKLYSFDLVTGRQNWSYFTGDYNGVSKTPVVSNKNVYYGSVIAIDPQLGVTKWSFNSYDCFTSTSVAVANGYVFVGSLYRNNNSFYGEGRINVLDEDQGKVIWSYSSGLVFDDVGAINPSPSVANGCVLVNLSTRQMLCFSSPERSPIASLSTSALHFNPYDVENGFVNIGFNLTRDSTLTVQILDYSCNPIYTITQEKLFLAGDNNLEWHGIIDCPELATVNILGHPEYKGVLIAPDGDYWIKLTASSENKQYIKTVPIEVKSTI